MVIDLFLKKIKMYIINPTLIIVLEEFLIQKVICICLLTKESHLLKKKVIEVKGKSLK